MGDTVLSIVIPAYNEEKRIGRTLQEIAAFHKRWSDSLEIIVSDDGSTDRTVAVVRDVAEATGLSEHLRVLRSPANKGKGHAVRTGMMASKGDYVLFCDADGATPIGEVVRLLDVLKAGYDVAIASRDLNESRIVVPQPWHRRVLGAVFRIVVSAFILKGFKDTQCGFKLFTRGACHEIFSRQTLNGFSFDVEVLFLAKQLGYSTCEVPVEWHDQPGTKVDLRSSLQVVSDIFLIRRRHRDMASRANRSVNPAECD